MDSFEKFNQTELPAKEHFYSIVNDQHGTNDEYDHAKKVWKAFKIKTVGQYHDLCLGSDVLLLADVFESSERPAYNTIRSIPVITSPPPACHGTLC